MKRGWKTALVLAALAGFWAPGCQKAPSANSSAPRQQDGGPGLLRAEGEQLLQLLREPKEEVLVKKFNDEFLRRSNARDIRLFFEKKQRTFGLPRRIALLRVTEPFSGEFELHFARGRMPLTLHLDPGDPSKIAGLFFQAFQADDDSLTSLRDELAALPGMKGLQVRRLEPRPETLIDLNPDQTLAIGSAFKLFLLAKLSDEVLAGRKKWTDVVPLRAEWRSLPSGLLQDWPEGSPVTLFTLASLMVSRSDNTAADQLLFLLGREKVEVALSGMGISASTRNRPLLSTQELFKLKLALPPEVLDAYAAADEPRRRQMLKEEVARAKLDEPRLLSSPLRIEDVEWFASPADLGRLLDRLRAPEQEQARNLLGIMPPFDQMDQDWDYVGFKGGAECGVICFTLLLKSRAGSWYSVAVAWNNPQQQVNADQLLGWVERLTRTLLRREQAEGLPKPTSTAPAAGPVS